MSHTAGAGLPTFRQGVHPAEHKEATEGLPVERMPFVDEYVLPLSQHIGAPSKAIVAAGQRVMRGQMIAKAGGFISTTLHAPVTGTVKAIELRAHPNGKRVESIVIETDPFASQVMEGEAATPDSSSGMPTRVQNAGIVGLGGAAFPSHVKLQAPKGKKVEFVILNGCECEPYLTCDHRVMVEQPDEVLRGLEILMENLGARQGYVGIENNKPDAIAILRERAAKRGSNIEVFPLQVKYPQGAEKTLIDAVLKKEVPVGKLPLDLEIVVNNVGTAAAIAALEAKGTPLIERVVTVTGPGIRRSANVMVPIGTPVRAVLDYCGGLLPETTQLIMGGPMMGAAQKMLDVPVIKGTSGLLALTTAKPVVEEMPCIKCGRCLEACPMFLNPSRLHLLVRNERAVSLKAYNMMNCFECGSCSFSCPSNIPLAQLMRVGKAMVRQAGL